MTQELLPSIAILSSSLYYILYPFVVAFMTMMVKEHNNTKRVCARVEQVYHCTLFFLSRVHPLRPSHGWSRKNGKRSTRWMEQLVDWLQTLRQQHGCTISERLKKAKNKNDSRNGTILTSDDCILHKANSR